MEGLGRGRGHADSGVLAPDLLQGQSLAATPRVQVPNNHILAKILTYITTVLKPST